MYKDKENSLCPMIHLTTGRQKRDSRINNICVSIHNNNLESVQVTVTLFNSDILPVQVEDQRVAKIPARCTGREIFVTKTFVNYEIQVEIPGNLILGVDVVVSVPEIIFSFNSKK